MNPVVSVIMPIYNAASYMTESVKSVLSQSFKQIELILVDDGSTDNSLKICNVIANEDKRVKVIHTNNMGPGNARNTGLDNAAGEYVCFVDSDDFLRDDAIEIMLGEIGDADLLQCRSIKKYPDGAEDGETWPGSDMVFDSKSAMKTYLYDSKPVIRFSVWAKLYRMSAVKQIKFPDMTYSEDVVFNALAIERSKKIKYIAKPLYYTTVREGSVSRAKVNRIKLLNRIRCSETITQVIENNANFSEFLPRANWSQFMTLVNVQNDSSNLTKEERKNVTIKILKSLKRISCAGLSGKQRITVVLFKISPRLTSKLIKAFLRF